MSPSLYRSFTLLSAATVLLTAATTSGAFDLALITAEELQREQAAWHVLDARPQPQWAAGHLPGALPFSWEEHTATDAQGVRYRTHPPGELAAALGQLGIDADAGVAVYGDADTSWGGEGWVCWVLAWLGHRGPVRLLDGGIQAWRDAGLPLQVGGALPVREPRRYPVQLRPEVTWAPASDTDPAAATLATVTLVDVRGGWERWRGGGLPGALALPWKELYRGSQRRPLAGPAYRELLQAAGIDGSKTLVFYCTGGIRSAYAWTVHHLARHGGLPRPGEPGGLGNAANYEGGTAEWEQRSATE